jgi:hypothetical protein
MNREHSRLLETREKKPFLVLPEGPYSGEWLGLSVVEI